MAVIRPAERGDIPRMLALYDELALVSSKAEQEHPCSTADYEQTLERIRSIPGYRMLVIEEGGHVAGLMQLLIMPNLSHSALPWALVEGLVVDSRYLRRGLGKALMQHAVQLAREAGCYKIELSSNKKRIEAHSFYRSFGFEESALGFRLYF